jgi:hypothetical protein
MKTRAPRISSRTKATTIETTTDEHTVLDLSMSVVDVVTPAPVVDVVTPAPVVDVVTPAPVVDVVTPAPVVDVVTPPLLVRQNYVNPDLQNFYPINSPVLERQNATLLTSAEVVNNQAVAPSAEYYKEKLQMMEQIMKTQADIMAKLMQQQQYRDSPTISIMEEKTVPPPIASWPELPSTNRLVQLQSTITEPEFDPLLSRRENTSRSFQDVYADEKIDVSKNITLTDASAGRWGSIPQTPTNVGMRTRGLLLNPTLQQPSIGGLL